MFLLTLDPSLSLLDPTPFFLAHSFVSYFSVQLRTSIYLPPLHIVSMHYYLTRYLGMMVIGSCIWGKYSVCLVWERGIKAYCLEEYGAEL